MKSYKLLGAIAVGGFLLLDVARAQTYSLNFKLTLQAQDLWRESVGNSPIQKSTVVKLRVTNKDMLKLLGVSFSQDFSGDTLTLQSGHFQIRNSSGSVVRDATSSGVMANFEAVKTDYVLQETIDNSKGTYNGVGYCTSIIGYSDLRGNNFSINGTVQDTMKHNSGGSAYSFKFSGTGTGALLTPPDAADPMSVVVFSGTLDGKSR